jgi:hypothetical protein
MADLGEDPIGFVLKDQCLGGNDLHHLARRQENFMSGFSNAIRIFVRRVSGSRTSLMKRTLPVKTSPGYAEKTTSTSGPFVTSAVSFSGTFAVTQMVPRLAIVMIAAGGIVEKRAGRHLEVDHTASDRRFQRQEPGLFLLRMRSTSAPARVPRGRICLPW